MNELERSLSTLLGEIDTNHDASIQHIDIDMISPNKNQPRRDFEDIHTLSESIKTHGVLQPIIVRNSESDTYYIIAGERRWRASKAAGFTSIPAIVIEKNAKEAYEITMIENIQRSNLNPIEEAIGYQYLVDEFGYTKERVARVIGKSRPHVSNMIRLLVLPEYTKELLSTGIITVGHAKLLINLENADSIARSIIEKNLSVKSTETLIRNIKKQTQDTQETKVNDDNDIIALENSISAQLGLPINIRDKDKIGEVRVKYKTVEELEFILNKLSNE